MSKLFKARVPKPARPRARSATRPQTPPVDREKLEEAARQKARERTDVQTTDTKPANTTGEVGGPDGPEPTRYGDWERGGICYDF